LTHFDVSEVFENIALGAVTSIAYVRGRTSNASAITDEIVVSSRQRQSCAAAAAAAAAAASAASRPPPPSFSFSSLCATNKLSSPTNVRRGQVNPSSGGYDDHKLWPAQHFFIKQT
jgi:hypothetical protein